MLSTFAILGPNILIYNNLRKHAKYVYLYRPSVHWEMGIRLSNNF